MYICIGGYRGFNDYEKFKAAVLKVFEEWKISISLEKEGENDNENIVIVSGASPGADTMAERFADEFGLQKKIEKPDWNNYGKAAGPMRNSAMIKIATHFIGFPSQYGRGTQDTIRKAQKKGIPTKVLFVD